MAYQKLKSLEKRLLKTNLMECYNQEMKLNLDEYAEPVSPNDIANRKGWYINHFPVLRPGKSTSCRIVWNSAAVYKGVSLNDGLFKGPDLLNNLFCVLLAWRQHAIAITGDIRKMFNQIQLASDDRKNITDSCGGVETFKKLRKIINGNDCRLATSQHQICQSALYVSQLTKTLKLYLLHSK